MSETLFIIQMCKYIRIVVIHGPQMDLVRQHKSLLLKL